MTEQYFTTQPVNSRTTVKNSSLFFLFAGIAISLPASAKMYQWVDDNGTRHMESTCPRDCAGKDHFEIDKGRKTLIKGSLTIQERRAERAATLDNDKKSDEELAHIEQVRKDKALLNTYTNTAEIDLARKRNMQQLEARVNSMASQVKIVNDRLLGLQKEAEGYKQKEKPLPASLNDDLIETESRLGKLQVDYDKAKAEEAKMTARYDADIARYKELTGK